MVRVSAGQVPGTELAAGSGSWQGITRGPLVAETRGLESLLPQLCFSAATHGCLRSRPDDQGHEPVWKQTVALGSQEGGIRGLEPRRGEGP